MNNAVVAMICITILEGIALYQNIDGVTLSAVIGIIAGLGGYIVGRSSNP